MSLIHRAASVALVLALAAPGAALADTYTLANFSGAINGGNANVKAPFSGNGFTQGMAFSGSFLTDNNDVPAAASGFVNVFDDSFPDAPIIPQATLFSLNFGPLSFTAADNDDSQIFNGPGIQYNNGHFNGFEFIGSFTFQSNPYQLRIDGPSLTVKLLSGGFPTGSNLINGHINVGDANVTDGQPFTPTQPGPGPGPGVPEPAAWALMLTGFGAAGAMLRRRRSRALA